ncbi:MAG TPA: hypothetical protein VFA83_23345 [Acidimicrobiales bacterium]|nr:hypothetical protein [Acidimicrobiales bacterium]
MAIWKTHSLATEPQPEIELRTGQKVEAIVDLPGVPSGTKGKVTLANGFNWRRYSVLFANGERKTFLDARHIKAA